MKCDECKGDVHYFSARGGYHFGGCHLLFLIAKGVIVLSFISRGSSFFSKGGCVVINY